MDYLIRFLFFVLVTFVIGSIYEKRRKNEVIIFTIYFAVVAVIFLL